MKVNHKETLAALKERQKAAQKKQDPQYEWDETAWLQTELYGYDSYKLEYPVYHYVDEICELKPDGFMALCLCNGELIRHRQGKCPHRMPKEDSPAS